MSRLIDDAGRHTVGIAGGRCQGLALGGGTTDRDAAGIVDIGDVVA